MLIAVYMEGLMPVKYSTPDIPKDPLAKLYDRQQIIRDRVRGVAQGHQNGFYLYGRPGTCKTHTVITTLKENKLSYEYFKGSLPPIGLFDLLSEWHDRVIVLDDVSSLYESKNGINFLLAALGTQPDDRTTRIIKYKRNNRDETIRFTGGIIAISNLELHGNELLDALKSRVNCLQHAPTDEEMEALMHSVAAKGWDSPKGKMTAKECQDVATFLIEESHRSSVRLDMRHLVDKAFSDFIQHRNGDSESHWKDLIRSTLQEQVVELKHTPTAPIGRRVQKVSEHEIIRQIKAEFKA